MSFSTSISGLDAAQERMAVISNNIVNAGTVGFKGGEHNLVICTRQPFKIRAPQQVQVLS